MQHSRGKVPKLPANDAMDLAKLVTCDDRFLKTARRHAGTITVTVSDPVAYVSEASFS